VLKNRQTMGCLQKPMEHAGATYPACPSAFFRQGADTNKAG
jgi:hypothetical protein